MTKDAGRRDVGVAGKDGARGNRGTTAGGGAGGILRWDYARCSLRIAVVGSRRQRGGLALTGGAPRRPRPFDWEEYSMEIDL